MDRPFSKSKALKLFGALLGLTGIYLLPLFTVPGVADIFLKVESIAGESKDKDHAKWIDTFSFSHGVSRQILSGKAGDRFGGTPQFSDVFVTKRTDLASPPIFTEVVGGQPRTVDLELVRGTDVRQRYYRLKLYEAVVTALSQSSGGDVPTESVGFAFSKIEMTYTEFSTKTGTEIGETTAWYDIPTQTGGLGTPTANTPPTISAIPATNTLEDTAVTVSFTVGDAQTAVGSLSLSASTSNGTLAPVSNITFGGSGASRTATIRPATNQVGSATITIFVSDGSANAGSAFVLTVNAVNDAPTIVPIGSRATEMGVPLTFFFDIADVDDAATNLSVTAQSSNLAVVETTNIVFTGTGATRSVTITPQGIGDTTITFTVSDGLLQSSTAFLVTVNAYTPKSPTDIVLSDSLVPENSANGFVIGSLSAADPDSTNHVFVLLDSADGRFRVQGNQLQVNDSNLLDFENGSSHSILVRATDGDGLSFSKNLTIEVINVNEAPVFIVDDNSIIETVAGFDTPVARLQVNDPDAFANNLTLTLQVVNGTLTISSNFSGVVTSNGTDVVTLSDSLTNLNTLLALTNGLIYRAATNLSGTDLLTATLNDNGNTGSGGPQSVYTTLGIRFYHSRFEQWLHAQFTENELTNSALQTSLWGPHADSDGDGLENLTEYALGTPPREGGHAKPTANLVEKNGQKHLSIELPCRRDPLLVLTAEVSNDVAGGEWTAEELMFHDPIDLNNGFDQMRFDDLTPTTEANRRFMRIRWSLDDASLAPGRP